MELELRVNGLVESLDVAPGESLVTLLRRNGYTSVKQGCETGECGACTVLVDGVPRPSCVMLAAQAGGCTLTTVEGLGTTPTLHPIQQAFIDMDAVQCGFCTPGMMLSASALLQRIPNPTEDDVRDALSGNLCRCTGYVKPVQAIMRAAAIVRGELSADYSGGTGTNDSSSITGRQRAIADNGTHDITAKQRIVQPTTPFAALSKTPLSVVGKSVHIVDAAKFVTGRSTFADDSAPRGMLYGAILTSPHPHAVIRSIDTSEARAMLGVHAVLTYEDVPRIAYASNGSSGPQDRYVLDYIVRYVGDRVAAVAAETPELAQEALERIVVSYDVLPALLDPRQTLETDTVRIHAESESRNIYAAERNIAARVRTETGDVERGFAESDVVIEGEYLVPMSRQSALETRTVITYFDEDDYLVVRSNNAFVPHLMKRVLASVLAIPARRIRVEQPALAGGPATMQGIDLEDVCAMLTQVTRKPVRLSYTRAEELRESHSYPQQILRMKTGVRSDGTLLANQMIVLASTGAYGTYIAPANSVLGLYPCASTRFVTEVLYTNHPAASNMPGADAELFALESHFDEIAHRLGMDALALRRKNWLKTGQTTGANEEGGSLSECMQLVETKLQWREKRGQVWNSRMHRGVGVALTNFDNALGSAESSGAVVKLNDDGSCDVFVSVADPTIKTELAQVAAEVLSISVEDILLHTSGTEDTPFATTTNTASTLYNAGAALRRAAELARRQVLIIAGRLLNVMPETLTIQGGTITPSLLNGQPLTVALVAFHLLTSEGRQIIVNAAWKETTAPTAFAVQGAEVEVDTETGAVRVVKLIAAIDGGRIINPVLAEGQIQGSMTQGLGMCISEEMLYDAQGQPLTSTLRDYHIYNALEMPELQTYLIQSGDITSGAFGAKSVVEVARSGVAPAVANAVADALGMRIRQLPLTPERVLRAIHAKNAKR